jgi:hypothetical protein
MKNQIILGFYFFLESLFFFLFEVFAVVGTISILSAKVLMSLTFLVYLIMVYQALRQRWHLKFLVILIVVISFFWHIFIGIPFFLDDFNWCPTCP